MTTDVFFPRLAPTASLDPLNHSIAAQPPATSLSTNKRKWASLTSSIPATLAAMAVSEPPKIAFDFGKHIVYVPPKKVFTMQEIGKNNQGVSPNAVSDPFPLFTKEAIMQMRSEILSKAVLENCQYSSNLAQCQLRGMAPQ